MFSLLMPPPLITASVQYRCGHNLSRACRDTVRVKCTAGTGHSATHSGPSLEKDNTTATERVIARETTLGETVRFGSFDGDELVHKECFVVRCPQVVVNQTATIETIASFLQETSCNRAQRLGWSTDGFPTAPAMRKHCLICVGKSHRKSTCANMEVYEGDVVEIEHWCEQDGTIVARLYHIIRNLSTGEVIGRATSKWLMMNQDTRKLHRISGEVREEFLATCAKSPRLAFSDENDTSLKKIPKLHEPADFSQLGLLPRRSDLNMNKHVNNVTYMSWFLQSIPQDIVLTHELVAITLEYRQECQYGSSVDSLSSIEIDPKYNSNSNSEDHHQFLHLLKFSGTNHEINRGRTVWKKLEGT